MSWVMLESRWSLSQSNIKTIIKLEGKPQEIILGLGESSRRIHDPFRAYTRQIKHCMVIKVNHGPMLGFLRSRDLPESWGDDPKSSVTFARPKEGLQRIWIYPRSNHFDSNSLDTSKIIWINRATPWLLFLSVFCTWINPGSIQSSENTI